MFHWKYSIGVGRKNHTTIVPETFLLLLYNDVQNMSHVPQVFHFMCLTIGTNWTHGTIIVAAKGAFKNRELLQ